MAFIQQRVAAHYGSSVREMVSPDALGARSPVVCVPRHVAMYLCRKLLTSRHSAGYPVREMSMPLIARQFNRDHTTVLNALRRVERRIAEDAEFKREIETIKSEIVSEVSAFPQLIHSCARAEVSSSDVSWAA